MATAPTLYQKRMAARRATSDIERLSKSYQTGMLDVTQKQQNAFKEWQAKSAEQMAPYQAAVKQYTSVDFPAYQEEIAKYNTTVSEYETKASAYRQRLTDFQKQLEDVQANPMEVVNAKVRRVRGGGAIFTIDGVDYGEGPLPDAYRLPSLPKNYSFQDGKLFRERAIPTFTEEPPAAPSEAMPVAPTPPGEPPTIAGLDVTPFAKQRAQLESSFKREVGERKAAKMNVAMRRMGRPMLQET